MGVSVRPAALILGAAVVLAAAPAGAETAARSAAIAIVAAMPATLGPFQRVGSTDYEARRPGLGHSVRYRHRDGTSHADVFVYDLGRGTVPDGAEAAAVRAQHAQMLADVERVYQRQGRRILDRREVENVAPRLRCTAFRFVDAEGQSGDSLACLTGAGGQFVKIRLTGPADDETVAAARRFVADAVTAARAAAR